MCRVEYSWLVVTGREQPERCREGERKPYQCTLGGEFYGEGLGNGNGGTPAGRQTVEVG